MSIRIVPKIRFFTTGLLLLLSVTSYAKLYRGAEYRTFESFLYGRFEVRMQSAAGHGVVSSFFTYRDYHAEGLSGTQHWNEIDLEWMGKLNNKVSTNVIIQNEWGSASEVFLSVNPHLDFNTYAFEWTPDAIRWYEGDRLIRTVSGERADSVYHAQKIMMNIWQPSNTTWAGSFNPDILPVYAFYDWVSYSAYDPGNGSVGTNNDFTPLWVDDFDYWDTSRWQKATHTWDGNNVDFTPANAVFNGGFLVLCMTTPTNTGYDGPALSVDEDRSASPTDFYLSPAYPNPFNGEVQLSLETPASIDLTVSIYDTLGNLMHQSLLNGNDRSRQIIRWDGRDQAGVSLASGTYIIQVSSESQQGSQKVILLK
ncbi:MAG: family 16 glycosylhydrolase [Candidatus Marinimicrobia bacterium]|nr:family 16 glycosylhydrolase [FCB group bacterium]MBL7025056.1 family 16 glycosylhydrolase [Candidatus Neomarinimicrobiota bacterium]